MISKNFRYITAALSTIRKSVGTAFILFMAGCASGPDMSVNYDKSANIDQYRTFTWHPTHPIDSTGFSGELGPEIQKQIKNDIERFFVNKGYDLTPSPDNADFTVKVTVGKRTQIDRDKHREISYDGLKVTRTGPGGRFEVQRGFFTPSGIETVETINQYTEGSFSIDIYDNTTYTPVWSGRIQSEIDLEIDPVIRRQRLQIAVQKMLERFPSSSFTHHTR